MSKAMVRNVTTRIFYLCISTMVPHRWMHTCLIFMMMARTATANCPSLVPGPHMVLSAAEGYVGDQPVSATCEAGYKLLGDILKKYLVCDEISGTDAWNDTVGECVLKSCLNATTPDLMDPLTDVYGNIGDVISMTCLDGYAISVNAQNKSVVKTQTVACEDDITNVTGFWKTPKPCVELACFPPPIVPNTVQTYTDVTVGSDVTYLCESGYFIPATPTTPMRFGLKATCNSSAMWEAIDSDIDVENVTFMCFEIAQHIGCLPAASLVQDTVTYYSDSTSGVVTFCRELCMDTDKTIAAIMNNTCVCGGLIASFTFESDCFLQCPDFDVRSMDSQAFCGGIPDLYTVFSTFDGCYDNINLNNFPSENVTFGDVVVTCQERCRGQGYSHAGMQNVTCICLNGIVTDAVKTSMSSCVQGDAAFIYDLAKHSKQVTTCQDLYNLGVQMHGEYRLSNTSQSVYCYFLDGTQCGEHWVGYNGYCYEFRFSGTVSFDDARDYCLSSGADILSIVTKGEQEFISNTLKILTEASGGDVTAHSNNCWLGLVDSHQAALYTWLDGNVMPFAAFGIGDPKPSNGRCIYMPDTQWQASSCSDQRRVVCKKPQDGIDCVSISPSPVGNPNFTDPQMTMTLCIEVCRGQSIAIALIQNDVCNCVTSLPAFQAENKTACSTKCPGNSYQYCGGRGNYYTAVKVTSRAQAQSCSELQILGIGNGTFLTRSDSSPQYCGSLTCPYAWVSITDHCFKFEMAGKTSPDAIMSCARLDAYTAVLDTAAERDMFTSAAGSIAMYSAVKEWRVGLSAQSLNGGVYHWANGKRVNTDLWNQTRTTSGKTSIIIHMPAGELGVEYKDDHAYVCEKAATEYIGCFNTNATVTEVKLEEYKDMSVQQCVELCRASNHAFAFLSFDKCACADYPPTNQHEVQGQCTRTCSGQSNQVCGGLGDLVSVYNVSAFEQYTSCEDLFYAGIFLSKEYIINGTKQQCDLIDGTVCEDGWVGHHNDCYRHYINPGVSHFQTCKEANASVTPLVNLEEYMFLMEYITRLNFGQTASRVFTGVTNGGYGFDVGINPDGSIMHTDLVKSDAIVTSDWYDTMGHLSFRINKDLDLKVDGGVICKKDKDVLGCFEKPTDLALILQTFGSMHLAFCKQVCLAKGSEVALMGHDSCACVDESQLSQMNKSVSSSCHVVCDLQYNQYCGDGTVMWAHTISLNRDILATDCADLYRSAVFYNATYVLQDDIGAVFYNRCGFSDSTTCPTTWLGYNGDCFKFVVTSDVSAHTFCSSDDAFLFNPTSNDLRSQFVSAFTHQSRLFDNSYWGTGLWSVMYRTTFVQSDGRLVQDVLPLDVNNSPHGFTKYTMVTGHLANINILSKDSFICQKNSDYLGCFSLNAENGPSFKDDVSFSLTTCLQWCQGHGYLYAAVSLETCQCLNSITNLTSAGGACTMQCEDVPTQTCGGDKVFTVVRITDETGTARTCRHLYTYGVTRPGLYLLQLNDSSFHRVNCFNKPAPLSTVPVTSIAPSVSSTLKGSSAGYIPLTFPLSRVWQPAASKIGEWIKVKLDIDYIITGIFITGIFTPTDQSHVTAYKLQYMDPVTSTLHWYAQSGMTRLSANCNEDTGVPLCYTYFWRPFLSKMIILHPLEWKSRISVQLEFMGQDFTRFDVNKTYIGCCFDEDSSFNIHPSTGSLQECILACRNMERPFASIDSGGNCYCGTGCPDNGFLDDDQCPYNPAVGQRAGGGVARPIYRTYVSQCEDPTTLLENRTITSIDYRYQNDVMTYGTVIYLTCAPGWEPVNPFQQTDDMIFCQQTHTWTNTSLQCREVYCPTFSVNNGIVNTTATELVFNSSLNVTCNDTYYATNGDVSMEVKCQQNHTWTTIPSCKRENAREVQKTYDLTHVDSARDPTHLKREVRTRSKMDCAVKCTQDFDCVSANYKDNGGKIGGTCRIYWKVATPDELTFDTNWQYIGKRN